MLIKTGVAVWCYSQENLSAEFLKGSTRAKEPVNCPYEAASHPEVKYILEVAQQSHVLILDFMALKLRVWMVSVAHLHP